MDFFAAGFSPLLLLAGAALGLSVTVLPVLQAVRLSAQAAMAVAAESLMRVRRFMIPPGFCVT
ncbi:hypothetical protein [Streptomyces mirabilis]|uniref:hypothetical protein n=1 Tax=Streptomyces mirabilis TaxID=68239 RepID=UPI0038053E48